MKNNLKFLGISLVMTALATGCGKPIKIPMTMLDGTYHYVEDVGNVTNIINWGRFVFAASEKGVSIVDTYDFDNIRTRGLMPGEKHDLVLNQEGYLYTVTSGGRFEVYDVTDQDHPYRTFYSAEEFPGPFVGIAFNGAHVVVAGGDALYVYDAANPADPTFLTSFRTDEITGYYDVSTKNAQVYLSSVRADGALATEIVDLSGLMTEEPSGIASLGRIFSTIAPGEYPLETPGNFILQTVFSEGFLWTSAHKNIYGYDIDNPAAPKKDRRFKLESTPVGLYEDQYVTGGFNGDVDLWAHYEDWKTKIHFVLQTDGEARAGILKKETIYVADGSKGLLVFDGNKLKERLEELYDKYKDKIPKNKRN